MMTGLFFKELRMNWGKFLGLMAAFGFSMFLPFMAAVSAESAGDDVGQADLLIRLMFLLFGFFIASMIQSNVFIGDETKKWGYFTATHPKGVKGQVFYKYLIVFLMILWGVAMCYFFNGIYAQFVFARMGVDVPNVTSIYLLMAFFQILMRAIELPFYIRFGAQRGGHVKMLFFLGAFIVLLIYLLFGPLPKSVDDAIYKVFDFVMNLHEGKSSDTLILGLGVFQAAAVAAYYFSYKISCRLYMKGVEQYDK